MTEKSILSWLDALLKPGAFDDVSNNGLQIARRGTSVRTVAFAVDASRASVRAAAAAKADLLVVHHGISWGGGIRRLSGGVYEVVKAALDADLALYAAHLPLDANRDVGNNWELARFLGLRKVKSAFSWRGATIGVIGTFPGTLDALFQRAGRPLSRSAATGTGNAPVRLHLPPSPVLQPSILNAQPLTVGICSGGGGGFAAEAKELGCDLFITGEADWGETIAAENVGMAMVCAGHYETETFGVKALMRRMAKELKVKTVFLERSGER